MKTLSDLRIELTAIQQSLAVMQDDLQTLIDAPVPTPTPDPAPEIPKITIPLNTPVELVV